MNAVSPSLTEMEMTFSPEQEKAIEYCTDIKRRVVSVTGEAGTGKTTILRNAVATLRDERGRSVCLAAPTGRAARRITEASGMPATTIHKLLGFGKPEVDAKTGEPTTSTFASFNKNKPLPFDDIFVDEYMMVNEGLHRDLLDALKPGARLIAFGDVAQLPPIEPYYITEKNGGIPRAPFEYLLTLPSSVTLGTVFRQQEGSGILLNAQRIRKGTSPISYPDFQIERTEFPIKVLRDQVYAGAVRYSELRNQIITPSRRGPLGSHGLNAILQAVYHPANNRSLSLPRHKWDEKHPVSVQIGEKVICGENTYDMRDFFSRYAHWQDDLTPDWHTYIPCPDNFMMLNGEIGLVSDIFPDGAMDIQFDDRLVHVPSSYRDYNAKYKKMYTVDPRMRVDLAYAVTTHKMQGSECGHVCYVMHQSMWININRNNIYTAITRARDGVLLITDNKSLNNGPRLTSAEKAVILQKNRKTVSVGDMG